MKVMSIFPQLLLQITAAKRCLIRACITHLPKLMVRDKVVLVRSEHILMMWPRDHMAPTITVMKLTAGDQSMHDCFFLKRQKDLICVCSGSGDGVVNNTNKRSCFEARRQAAATKRDLF